MKNHHSYDLSNGDLIRVESPVAERRRVEVKVKGQAPIELRFACVRISDVSAPERGSRMVWLLDNSLWLDEREDPASLTQALLVDFEQRLRARAKQIGQPVPKRGSHVFSQCLLDDELFNALRVRFGYALTCHKAQGGEWREVILKPKSIHSFKSEIDVRWLYTAVTRAQVSLFMMGAERNEQSPFEPNSITHTQASNTHAQSSSNMKVIKVKGLNTLNAEKRAEALLLGALELCHLRVLRLEHSQFLIKAFVESVEGQAASVEMNYKGTGKPSSLRGADTSTLGLSLDFLKSLSLAEESIETQNDSTREAQLEALIMELPSPFYQEQLRRAQATLNTLDIQVTKVQLESYALTLSLSGPQGEGRLKFYHNSKHVWTTINVVDATTTSYAAQAALS